MEKIFSKSDFPLSPGGDIYEWKAAKTSFQLADPGLYAIKIVAKAKDAKLNLAQDDDDLRVAINGYHFGKYEQHDEKISWRGYGTSSSWDGASLKGGEKTIYFFLSLSPGQHEVQFFADNTPEIESLEVFWIDDWHFSLRDLIPTENIETDGNGIPWLSFIFLSLGPRSLLLNVDTKSGKVKGSADGDNLKVIINGKVKQNERTAAKKYKNFLFAGDIRDRQVKLIHQEDLKGELGFESSVELWYDQTPSILELNIDFFNIAEFLQSIEGLVDFRKYVRAHAGLARVAFKFKKYTYSKNFLENSLSGNFTNLRFKSNHPIVRKVKADPTYSKIMARISAKINEGILVGEIHPQDFQDHPEMQGQINFDSEDLATALHGIKKIEYEAQQNQKGQYIAKIKLLDIYDFQQKIVPKVFPGTEEFIKAKIINALDLGEELGVVHNFEIEINIKTTINGN